MPAPIRPVQPGDLISAAKFNEVVDELNALGRISGAFPICVSHDLAGVRIEPAQQFKAWLFQIEDTPDTVPRTTDGVAYYSATRLRLSSDDEYIAQEPQHVVLYDPLTRAAPARVLRTGSWALATFNADTGRWEIVRDIDGGAPIVRFRTTTTLSIGGSATAVIVNEVDGADADGAEITVVDWSAPGTWYGPVGSQGIACKLPDRDEYDVLWLEHPSLFAVAYATGPMVAGVLPVTVTAGFDGAGVLSGTDTFYDVAGNYASAAPGETFVARLDPATSTYQIIDGPPGGASLIRFELYANLPEGGSALAHVVVWDAMTGTWPIDVDQLITVYDPENIGPGINGHRGWCTYRADSGKYEVVSLDEPPNEVGWFIATADHTLDTVDMSILHYVEGQVCDDSTGTDPHGDVLRFYLHSPSSATCPNVQYGAILPYHTDKNGRLVADGAYLDDYRGASKQHIGPVAKIPFGWNLCDGSNGTPDLRHKFLLMANGDAASDADWDGAGHGDQIGASGGTKGHNHFDANNIDETPVAGQLHHYRDGIAELFTDDVELNLDASPGQTIAVSGTSLSVSATGSISGDLDASGYTDYAKSNVRVIDPASEETWHQHHIHQWCAGSGSGGPFGTTDGDTFLYFPSYANGAGGPYGAIYTGLEIQGARGNTGHDSPQTYASDNPGSWDLGFGELDHDVREPGDTIDTVLYNPSAEEGITDGEHGHRHPLTGTIAVSGSITISGTIDPDPHDHTFLVKSVADAMWIVDVTHYDGDAGKYNDHYHDFEVDDHQLLPATHIPPYYALAQIMRVS